MKSTLRNILVVILSLCAVICMAVGLAACKDDKKVTRLEIENAKIDFFVGDEFTLGDDCVIYAVYKNGNKVDVTADVDLKTEDGMDMSVADEYQITVSYGGKKEVYSIYVSGFDNVLKKIELNTDGVKTQYALGEEIDLNGLKIKATYENAQGRTLISEITSLKGFDVEIKANDGTVIENTFTKLGGYTVTVSQGSVKANYTLNVEGINISTVQSAINIGKIFSTEVVSGTQVTQGSLYGGDYYEDSDFEYTYGDNYTYVKNTFESEYKSEDEDDEEIYYVTTVAEQHFSILDGEIFCAQYENDELMPNPLLVAEMMDGPVNLLWYSALSVYGIENTLLSLYKEAKVCTNKDLVETVDEAKREYSFKFSGLVNNSSRPDYYETTVKFKLGEKYNIEYAEYNQKYWENNATAEGTTGYVPSFETDNNGITVPKKAYSKGTHVVVNQQTGKRVVTNPYSKSMFTVTSFDLTYKGEKLDANSTIQCDMNNPDIEILISNIKPDTADLTIDRMLFSYEGNRGGYQDSLGIPVGPSKGFLAYRSGNVIKVKLINGGQWTLLIKTDEVEKSITFDVTGQAPTTIEPYIRNDASGVFYAGGSKTIALNGEVYFYGNVSFGLDDNQSASITSANAATATVEKTTLDEISCFKFKATAAGVYTVKVVSDSNASAFCEFTFTVSEEPDYAAILQGKYSVMDLDHNIYEVTFTPASAGATSGKVVIVKTPTDNDDNPITANAKTQTFNYSVNSSSMEIVLVAETGDNLGADLSINAESNLVLNDLNDDDYILQRVN